MYARTSSLCDPCSSSSGVRAKTLRRRKTSTITVFIVLSILFFLFSSFPNRLAVGAQHPFQENRTVVVRVSKTTINALLILSPPLLAHPQKVNSKPIVGIAFRNTCFYRCHNAAGTIRAFPLEFHDCF